MGGLESANLPQGVATGCPRLPRFCAEAFCTPLTSPPTHPPIHPPSLRPRSCRCWLTAAASLPTALPARQLRCSSSLSRGRPEAGGPGVVGHSTACGHAPELGGRLHTTPVQFLAALPAATLSLMPTHCLACVCRMFSCDSDSGVTRHVWNHHWKGCRVIDGTGRGKHNMHTCTQLHMAVQVSQTDPHSRSETRR